MIPFDANSILVDLLVSSVGLAFFSYGKKAERVPHLIAGLLLMVYPYFVTTAGTMAAIGALILLGLGAAVRQGF